MHTLARRWTVRTALGGLVLAGVAVTGLASPASASYYEGEDCSPELAGGPVAAGNQAPVAVDDDVEVTDGMSARIDVLGNDSDPDGDTLSIVGVGESEHGETCVVDGKILYWMWNTTGASSDTFTYAVTDGDYYRTATVHVTIKQIDSDLPAVTKKLRISQGKVARRAEVRVTNPDATHTIGFYAGDFERESRLVYRELAPGQTQTFKTSHRRLDFFVVTSDPTMGDDGEDSDVLVLAGRINTLTGVVRESSNLDWRIATHRAIARWTR